MQQRLKGLKFLGILGALLMCVGQQPVRADDVADGVDKGALQSVLGKKVSAQGTTVAIVKADWCGGCRKTMDSLEKTKSSLVKTHPDIGFQTFDLDKNPGLTNVVPLLVRFKDGKLVETHVGAMSPEALSAFARA